MANGVRVPKWSVDYMGMATSTPFLFASCIFCSCVLSRRQFYEARELFPSVPGHDLVYSSKCGSGNLRCYRRLLYVAISRENVWDREQVYFGSPLDDHVQSVAMVLFYKNLFQLCRDDIDDHGAVLLALEHFLGHHLRSRK